MNRSTRVVNLLVVSVLLVGTFFAAGSARPVRAAASNIVISQVYGWGGGGPGRSYFKHDYIELFNADVTTVDLNGWSLQWSQYTQDKWDQFKILLSGHIEPGHYFLVRASQINPFPPTIGGNYDLPIIPDLTNDGVPIGSLNGVVLLLNTTASFVGHDPVIPGTDPVVDLVSYYPAGDSPALPEWFHITTIDGYQSILTRKGSGCTNTHHNDADFILLPLNVTKPPSANPGPRNALSAPNLCPGQEVDWPQVTSTNPTNGQTNVSTTPIVEVNFNHAVTASSSSFDLLCNGTLRAYTLGGSAPTMTYTLQPTVSLASKTLCTVSVKRLQIVDAANNLPRADYIFSFSTTVPPADITLSTNRFYFRVPKGARIANFIVPDPNHLNETFTFQLVPGAGSTDNGLFKIVPNGLATNVVFRSTARIVYSVRVRATDSIGQSIERPLKLYISQKPIR